jgi:hypothetical protein
MSKRLQVLLDEAEFRKLRRAARQRGVTVAEWVRTALRSSLREVPAGEAERKLAAIRAAAAHSFPAADIDQMLAEIDRGRGPELPE